MKIMIARVLRIVFVGATFVCGSANGVWAAEGKTSAFELRRVVSDDENVASEILPWKKGSEPQPDVKVEKKALLDQRNVKNAVVEKDRLTGKDEVKVTLTKEGAELFSKVTRENIGKRLAVVSGRKVLIAPTIATEITGGTLVISGNFSAQEVQEIATLLSSKKD
jgi:preprotein translocase subunit SecD